MCMRDPEVRAKLVQEMRAPGKDWENLLYGAGTPDNVLLIAFKNPKLKPLTGKTLGEVARMSIIWRNARRSAMR